MPNFRLEKPSKLHTIIEWSKTASVEYSEGELVECDDDSSGVGFDKADATSVNHIGIVRQTISSSDSDYASTTRIGLEVDIFGYYVAEVGNGTPDANYEGYFADLTAAGKVNVAASSVNVFLIKDYLGQDVDGSTELVGGYITKWAYLS